MLTNAEANRSFARIMTSRINPEDTLRRMREVGILGRFIPDFAKTIGQMQFDMYHLYTVDEHILRLIGHLHRLEAGDYQEFMPLASQIIHNIEHREMLYVAALTHDIAKGRGGDHAIKGAIIAKKLALRFGYSMSNAELVEWLVTHHQLITDIAFKRDLAEPETISKFVEIVQTVERLRLLIVLTAADIYAVGTHIWNGWKAALLRELYSRAEYRIRTGGSLEAVKLPALKAVLHAVHPKEHVSRYLQECENSFLTGCPEEEHTIILQLLSEAERRNYAMHISVEPYHDSTRLTLLSHDRPGLMADVGTIMAQSGLTVIGARATTLKSGWAIQIWQVQDAAGNSVSEQDIHERIHARLVSVVTGVLDGAKITLPKTHAARHKHRYESFDIPTEITFDNSSSSERTVIEISALDRIGLLATVCRIMLQQGLSISSAHISTYGEKAVDVFYIKDRYGMKITSASAQQQLRESLHMALLQLQQEQAVNE
jgi:[protein-PII] uridylyltransferase